MKKILLCALVAMLSLSVSAQKSRSFVPIKTTKTVEVAQTAKKTKSIVRYQGEVSLGIGVHTSIMPYAELRTLHGIAVGDYFSAGIGLGFEIPFVIPLYFNARGYLPVSKMTRLFLGIDLGYILNKASFYVAPEFGASFKVSPKGAINVSATYKSYHDIWYHSVAGAVGVRVAFQF